MFCFENLYMGCFFLFLYRLIDNCSANIGNCKVHRALWKLYVDNWTRNFGRKYLTKSYPQLSWVRSKSALIKFNVSRVETNDKNFTIWWKIQCYDVQLIEEISILSLVGLIVSDQKNGVRKWWDHNGGTWMNSEDNFSVE